MKPAITLLVFGAALAIGTIALAGNKVATTKHNMSAGGPGSVVAASEDQLCIFCHTPHNANSAVSEAPLWNRSDPTTSYDLYDSSTFDATPNQPNGSSRLCLSCHDGTIAIGLVVSRQTPIAMAGGISTMPANPGGRFGPNLGTNLTNDHPVSFPYTSGLVAADGELHDPASLPATVKLDANNRLQCTTCHDPHDDTNGKFLVMDNTNAALCVTCHNVAGWASSPHKNSNATWNGSGTDPWAHTSMTSVSTNGCMNCHAPHEAGKPERLLTQAKEEDVCLVCHNGSVASVNLVTEFTKAARHNVGGTDGVHDPTENPLLVGTHVECADCHDPHRSYQGAAVSAPALPVNQTGVSGVNSAGTGVAAASFGFEVCYKCHTDNSAISSPSVQRQLAQTNVRLEFDPANPSFHPIETTGRSNDVPSLIAPWTETSQVACTDCHSTDSGTAKGPHGSGNVGLLKLNYSTTDRTPESPQAYALCYSCHSRTSILNDDSFGKHNRHITSNKPTPCSVCHDSHGISSTQGNTSNNTHLINFDTSVVQPNRNGNLRFIDDGNQRGTCDLLCHGLDHRGKSY